MELHPNRHLPIHGTYNIRDLGGYAAGAATTRWRSVLRADGLHRLNSEGMDMLVAEGVATVIDLRSVDELAKQPNPFHQNAAVRYHNVSLFADLAPSYRPGEDTLLDLYKQALRDRRDAIREVLTLIADAADGIVLFHCTAGKDRTGIIAALLLANAGVATASILEDYALTSTMIAPMIDEFLATAAAQGADIEQFRPLLGCDPATMSATIAHVESEYGSVGQYLSLVGLAPETVRRLTNRLLGEI